VTGQPDATYRLLRHMTLPLAAITTSARGRRNGLIVNSAQRASLVPSLPRISLYVSKPNFSHDLIYASGLFGAHLLRGDQWDVIRALGLRSGRDVEDKFEGLAVRTGVTGIPMLSDVIAGFECRVVNAMDAGAATFFLGDVVDVQTGVADVQTGVTGDIMTSTHFRSHAPVDLLAAYDARLKYAQGILEPLANVTPEAAWNGGTVAP
jgi:flavin reductase (DIM6/NTAB) family NADH-FMN oxidoreductase RutF